MRDIVLFMNISLDGYFEAPGHDISWATQDFEAFSQRGDTTVDALLFGRRTYEMMRAFWPTEQAGAMLPDVAAYMNAQPKVVVTHDASYAPGWSNVRVLSDDVLAGIRELKQQGNGTLMMFGSNMLAVALLEHGLLDIIQTVVNPVAIGAGTPLFAGLSRRIPLDLTGTRQFKSGSVQLTYRPR